MTDPLAAIIARHQPAPGDRTCRGCGCTDSRACPGGCAWLLLDIAAPTGVCTTCAEILQYQMDLLASIGIAFTFGDLESVEAQHA